MEQKNLKKTDPEIYKLVKKEEERQQDNLSMIPSENFFSCAVREAVGSAFMHKYSEGNIGQRYYEGNDIVDEMETIAIERAKKLFKLPADWGVNIQALAGSNANLAVYLAVLNPGDTMMAMYLPDGGHLSHGWSYQPKSTQTPKDRVYLGGENKIHITSRMFNVVQYKTDPKTATFDYEEIQKIAKKYKPKLLITGGTAYMRDIDYKKMSEIAHSVGALYMADIAHEAGLIGAGVLNSPVGFADVVTLTTHKTLRSGRGAIIMAKQDLIKKINRGVLPGLQGGPFNNNIAGIAVGLGEALKPEFKKYAKQVIKNAQTLAEELTKFGFTIVSGGTDKHLVLVNMTNKGIYGKKTAKALNEAGIVLNMNTMPGETRVPADPSAIRMGSPLLTTRGMKEKEMIVIAGYINTVVEEIKQWKDLEFTDFIAQVKKSKVVKGVKKEVKDLCGKFPLEF
ncbi:serine hydroxymethyltransferase [Candidatus Dojkabacteria bacterium]|nr:serine hydroxymethyltransferase [Candidatus Dojkabacteria bacterium]